MPHLARYLQEAFERNCPRGWRCCTEARVVTAEVEDLLGYAPQADAVLQEVATERRVWVELEVSWADPVANHAKFATAHLFSPMPRRASAFPRSGNSDFHPPRPAPHQPLSIPTNIPWLTYGQMAISP